MLELAPSLAPSSQMTMPNQTVQEESQSYDYKSIQILSVSSDFNPIGSSSEMTQLQNCFAMSSQDSATQNLLRHIYNQHI